MWVAESSDFHVRQVSSGKEFLYATNFHDGVIEMYDASFHFVKNFTDSSLPPGYAPFGIRNINGDLYVTFALQNDAKHDDVGGPGHGFIDVFSTDGTWLSRFASQGALNSPWGMALAPGGFGSPSSVAEPFKLALKVGTVWLGPAFTSGRLLTVMTTLSLPERPPSLVVSFNV